MRGTGAAAADTPPPAASVRSAEKAAQLLERALPVTSLEFCAGTLAPFDDSGCHWQAVGLPHRWELQGDRPAWGLYRAVVPHPGLPVLGVLTERLSLNGRVRAGGAGVPPALAPGHDLAHLRYWPQLYAVSTGPARADGTLLLEIAVRGHPLAKNGLGSLALAPPGLAQSLHERELRREVVALLALAAATAMAGLVGLAAGDFRSLAGRLLRVVAWVALFAAARMAANYWTSPPLPVPAWSILNLLLLAAIAMCSCLTMAIYLWPARPHLLRWAVATGCLLATSLAMAPPNWFYPLAEGFFAAVSLVGALLFGRVLWRTVHTRDALGGAIALPVLGIVVLGVHDLLVHLGGQSMSDGYLQKWSVPGLLILMIVLLGRRVGAQQSTEAALARETARREELLRDLHDGIGSRLVALSFHARRGGDAVPLGEEIDALLRELQLIQGAVRAGPTTLQALIADLRHQYARLGGGNLPLQWPAAEDGPDADLSAEQAVATVRIFEEAVANAVKHARPQAITVALEAAQLPDAAALCVSDDGGGGFQPEHGRGLRNMRVRAERAGLGLRLEQGTVTGRKTVRVLFPGTRRRHTPGFSTT